ncbi:MAG TPA: bifunctional DNA-formamidopyrimidine glycosylase/DNA-(apurinic or apyrimidinic site) lyase [Rhizomicrobium sp.]|nr:bifunctional DNA-formamidopyrimidine glycosylase/DNA-(apurinic or apyrimidinic site) lyase [Rhizomicrobium sp.]
MPELPEVETVRAGLAPVLEGHAFTHVEIRRGDLRIPFPNDFVRRLTGRNVTRLWRRAKYLMAELDSGETFVIHLGMSGRIAVFADGKEQKLGTFVYPASPPEAGLGKHDHVVMRTDAPARIVFTDHRRFGLMTLIDTLKLDEHRLFDGLGVEPLSKAFDAAYLARALRGKKTPIKSALLDQRVIAGLGNIYVCEALYRAHISPRRLAKSVSKERAAALAREIKAVLQEAIVAGGSSLRDHRRTDGEMGYFQKTFFAYDREGEACRTKRCKGRIKRIVQAGRSTFYCPSCQR